MASTVTETSVRPVSPVELSDRERVKAAIHLLDCAALYGEVFGLAQTAREYRAAAEQLLEASA